jgi:DNA-binding MarR family transcriptional regulator
MYPFDLDWQQKHLDGKIVVALERIAEAFRVLLWESAKSTGLSPIQIQILIFCGNHQAPYRTISYLASEFNMTKATISDSVRVLEEKLLLRRDKDQQDGRSYILSVTATGQSKIQETLNFSDKILKTVSGLSPLEKTNTFTSLIGIIYRLQKDGVLQVQRMCPNCRFYERRLSGPHCSQLNKDLNDKELRIDCPEYGPLI